MKHPFHFLFLFLFFLPCIVFALPGKTGIETYRDSTGNPRNTYALIIGLSEYKDVPPLQYADKDAEYAQQLSFDVSKIEPQVVPPPKRHTAEAVSRFAGTKISTAHIGSCANGRFEPPRLYLGPFLLSYAAMSGASSMA